MSMTKCLMMGLALSWALIRPVAGQTNSKECHLPSSLGPEFSSIDVIPNPINLRTLSPDKIWAGFKFTLRTEGLQLDPAKKMRVCMRDESECLAERFEVKVGNGNVEVLIRVLKRGGGGHRYYLVACYDGSSDPLMASDYFSFVLPPVRTDQSNRPISNNHSAVAKVTTSRGTAVGLVVNAQGHLLAPARLFAGARAARVSFRSTAITREVPYVPVAGCSRPIKGQLCRLAPQSPFARPELIPVVPASAPMSANEPLTLLTLEETKGSRALSSQSSMKQANIMAWEQCEPEKVGAPLVGKSGTIVAVYICNKEGKAHPLPMADLLRDLS